MSGIRPPFDAWPGQMMGSKSRMQGKEPSQQSVTRRVYLGIDVSKARLDVYIHPLGRTLCVSNDADGLRRLKKAIADCDRDGALRCRGPAARCPENTGRDLDGYRRR